MTLPSSASCDVHLAVFLAEGLWADACAHEAHELCDLEFNIRLWFWSSEAVRHGLSGFLTTLFQHPSRVRYHA